MDANRFGSGRAIGHMAVNDCRNRHLGDTSRTRLTCIEDETPDRPATVIRKVQARLVGHSGGGPTFRLFSAWAQTFLPYGTVEKHTSARRVGQIIDGTGVPCGPPMGIRRRFIYSPDVRDLFVRSVSDEAALHVGYGTRPQPLGRRNILRLDWETPKFLHVRAPKAGSTFRVRFWDMTKMKRTWVGEAATSIQKRPIVCWLIASAGAEKGQDIREAAINRRAEAQNPFAPNLAFYRPRVRLEAESHQP